MVCRCRGTSLWNQSTHGVVDGGRRRGEDEGELVGVVEGVLGTVLFDLMGNEMMLNMAAGRLVRSREMVFILFDRFVGFERINDLDGRCGSDQVGRGDRRAEFRR